MDVWGIRKKFPVAFWESDIGKKMLAEGREKEKGLTDLRELKQAVRDLLACYEKSNPESKRDVPDLWKRIKELAE